MGFIPEITCRHCGTKYSAIHSRCPSCGTPRKQTADRAPAPAAAAEPAAQQAAPRRTGSGKTAPLFNSWWECLSLPNGQSVSGRPT